MAPETAGGAAAAKNWSHADADTGKAANAAKKEFSLLHLHAKVIYPALEDMSLQIGNLECLRFKSDPNSWRWRRCCEATAAATKLDSPLSSLHTSSANILSGHRCLFCLQFVETGVFTKSC